ncbi:MAG: preprotein translocase subunit SecA [Rhodocyclaceae bacterium]
MRQPALALPGPLFGPYPESTSSPALPPLLASLQARFENTGLSLRSHQRTLARDLARVRKHLAAMPAMPGMQLRQAINMARAELGRDGLESDAALRCMAGVLVCVRAVTGHNLRDNQIMAALAVLRGQLAEMPTGEGKTLATALAAATAALAGVPVHAITSNDYLAARDADQLRPLYRLLGLTVSSVSASHKRDARIEAYAANVTYCSAKELVFDYLRDRLAPPPSSSDDANGISGRVLRGLCMAIIDEADSVLIDEAMTPFILSESCADPQQIALCQLALQIARELQPGQHFALAAHGCALLPAGEVLVDARAEANDAALWSVPMYRRELVTLALTALHRYRRDEHYIVRDGKVHIVDPNSGRVAEGRAWSKGLQQMMEILEGCQPTPGTRVLSQITFQRFFPRYHRIGGLSGTLREARCELLEVYGLSVVVIAPHKSPQLRITPPVIYAHREERWQHVLDAVVEHHATGQPVLIGTDSVRDSEIVSRLLAARGLPHRVLNARQDREEAELVSRAGNAGAITVTTNMAGRGTDIHIDAAIAALGGLHVISCQHNSSRRIDRQLHGRAGRQGQRGSAETFLSLDEGLLSRTIPAAVRRLLGTILNSDGQLPLPVARALAGLTQSREDARARKARCRLRSQDDTARQQLLFGRPAE